MGKAAARKRTTIKNGDPALDHLAMFDARTMMLGELVTMGWKLALMVLIPIFIGVQLDKHFDSKPSVTLTAFFIAIFGASMVIYKTYNRLNAQAALDEAKRSSVGPKVTTGKSRRKTVRRSKNA